MSFWRGQTHEASRHEVHGEQSFPFVLRLVQGLSKVKILESLLCLMKKR